MADILQRHGETYLHHTGSQWTIRLLPELPTTKDAFFRTLSILRNHNQLKELAAIEYLEVRPYTVNCIEDTLVLQLTDRDTIQHYCLNDRVAATETSGAARWMKRAVYMKDVFPEMYAIPQESMVSEWRDAGAEGGDWGAEVGGDKVIRFVKQYRYSDKNDQVEYIMEVRKATAEPVATMVAANLPALPESYHLRVVWGAEGIEKMKTKASYLDLGRTLYRHAMRLMSFLLNEPVLLTLEQQAAVMQSYGALVRKGRFIPRGREDDSARYVLAPKPVTLERVQLIEPGKAYCITSVLEHYAVTEKADGERMLLYVNPEGGCFLINNVAKPKSTGLVCTDRAYFNTLLDGEYVEKEKRYGGAESHLKDLYAVFDVYFVGGENVAGAPLFATTAAYKNKARNDWMLRVCNGNHWDTRGSVLELRAKVHRVAAASASSGADEASTSGVVGGAARKKGVVPGILKECAALLKEAKQKKTWYAIDGLIFTPTRLPVLGYYPEKKVEFSYNMRWDRVYKWKPAEMNTIDFLVSRGMRLPNPLGDGQAYREYILQTGFNVDQMLDLDILGGLHLLYNQAYRKQIHYGEGVYVPHVFRPFTHYEDGVHRAWIPEDTNGVCRAEEGDVIPHDCIVEFAYDRTDARTVSYRWRPLRVRHDKTRLYRTVDAAGNKTLSKTANDASTANNVWRSIHRPVSQDMIEGKVAVGEEEAPGCIEDRIQTDDDVYYAREIPRFHLLSRTMMNFHNMFVKSKLYAFPKVRHASLLELACGRAGDLKNWCNQRYGFVLGIDNSRDNILDPKEGSYARTIQTLLRKEQEVQSGKLDARFAYVPPIVYTVGDCAKPLRDGAAAMAKEAPDSAVMLQYLFNKKFPTRHPLYEIVPKLRGRGENGFDVVSCQFALHYFFESRETLDGFFQNVAENLKSGGYFIATFMDGARVDARLSGKSKAEGIVKESVVWAILKNYPDGGFSATRPYGNRIRVYLENINQLIPEYLVHFEFLIEFAAMKGLQLVDSKTFAETFREEKMKVQNRSNQRILDEFEAEDPVIREFSEFNRWVVFQKM